MAGATDWSAIVDAAPTGILLMHGDGRLVRANRAACDLLGLDANRLLVAYTSDYFGFGARRRRTPQAPMAEADPDHLQRVVRPDGHSRWIQFRLVPLAGPSGAPALVAVYLTDRTALHLQERTLRAQVAGADLALSEAGVAAVVTDGAGRVVRWSPGAAQLLGVAAADATGRGLAAAADLDPDTLDALAVRARGGETVRDVPLRSGPGTGAVPLVVSVTATAGGPPVATDTAPGEDGTRLAWVLLPAGRSEPGNVPGTGERRLRTIFRHLSDTVAILDETGRVVASSAAMADRAVLGHPPQAWDAGPNAFDLVEGADVARVGEAFEQLLAEPGAQATGTFRVRAADGGAIAVEAWAANLLHDPDIAGVLVTARDVSERARNEAFLAGQAEILRQVASAAPLELTMRPLVELVNGHVEGANAALLQVTGDGEGRTFSTRSFPFEHIEPLVNALGLPAAGGVRAHADLEVLQAFPELGSALRRAGCRGLALLPVVGASTDARTGHHVTLGALLCLLTEARTPTAAELDVLHSVADLAAIAIEREQSERDLAHQALHDELTGLANRHLLSDRLEQALNRAKRRGRSLALMFLDLDRFKTINDTLGHDVGDQLLRQFAERLRLLVRPEDTVARFGGDEFVVLVEHVVDEQEAALIAERLEGSMNEPFQLDGQQLAVTASVGIVIGKGDDQPAALLRNADTAMYRAKELGRNRTEIYDTTLEAHLADRTQLGVDLRTALVEGHLQLVYQPVVDLRSGEMRMIEALLRWDHPDHGRLLPLDFLAAAEDSGQGLELGAWVIERALTDLAAFARNPAWVSAPGWPRPPRLTVNLSARQLAHPELVARVELALVRHHFLPQNLAVDVSERALATAGEMALRNLDHLHRLGVAIALDDVGGGPSTALLNVLERVPADILKIDPSVIASMGLAERDTGDRRTSLQRSMAAGLLGLGRGLGLTVVAEGVDNPRRIQQLRQLGFDLAQGHAIGAPVEADQMVSLLPG